ncbi:glycosyltransferase [Marinihelvus fidelis]|uniref:glycosyltransferase n=1 Tax=Marinihelvus fidelis TaxID=2613842 RepID=UPI0017838E90|nr:glycosyltransferase [Marinihelvus fidelis]
MTVVYLTRTGLLEPLGQSQVFAYLQALASNFRIVLVTCEKKADFADRAKVDAARLSCRQIGIEWKPLPFEQGPRSISILRQLFQFAATVRREHKRGKVIVHARSYLPALAGLAMFKRYDIPFVFDMRALWPEELILARRLKRGSLVHKGLVSLERQCLMNGETVSLTKAAADHLEKQYPIALAGRQIHVIPTCADLSAFTPKIEPGDQLIFGCNGTVLSGWFRLDLLARSFNALADAFPSARLQIVTRDDHAEVKRRLAEEGCQVEKVEIFEAAPEEMPAIVQKQTASMMFFKGGLAKLGSCPTKLGEILGCGRPVISNRGIEEVYRIITDNRVGVEFVESEPATFIQSLTRLLADESLSGRCRQTAEQTFSLERGVGSYRKIYRHVSSVRNLAKQAT